nr:GNAT family N-acetyltransferase [Fictibacillus solisalsi]
MNEMTIRRPAKTDQEELNELFIAVIKHTFKKEGLSHMTEEMEEEIEQKKQFLETDLVSNGIAHYFLIAVDADKNKIIGTIACGPANELILSGTNGVLKDCLEIGTVFVHPAYQKQGVGSALLSHLIRDMREKGIIRYCLDSGYKQAQNVWRNKLGEPSYFMEDYWGEGNHHMIWTKTI